MEYWLFFVKSLEASPDQPLLMPSVLVEGRNQLL